MKYRLLSIILALAALAGNPSFSQNLPYQKGLEPAPLTPDEMFVLSSIPELEVPDRYKGPDAPLIPPGVDNSAQPYFRPITWQSGYECGQSAGIAFNFTYEVDRKRGVPANQPTTQYPTHFAWDFLNNGNNYQGASCFDSWEIVRACGTMNVADYGGALNTGGYLRWISGYDLYYNGMGNRLNSIRMIRVDTPEGLQALKYWLFDHLEGSEVGGVGNIYGQFFGTPSTTLPAGTPEAGKYVQTYWGGSPSHTWTVCGYNDSIRYDFNGDGQYTNNIDINNDGTVDMHDWEMGGLKFANGYSGTGWCDQGFCYTMYKNLADNIGYGGIWNHSIFVIDVKTTCSPKLTMKVTLKHTSRNKLKVMAGVNADIGATTPSYLLEFPIFNYQGGDYYMQGGTADADKTIEFGLDLTPLINQVTSGQPAKYFLQVQEADPTDASAGEIVNWSLIDYTLSTPVTIPCPTYNIPLQNNATTTLGLIYTQTVNKPVVATTSLAPAQLYQPYNAVLTATGGSPPYRWDAQLDYPETTTPVPIPVVTAQQLTLTNNNTGYAIKTLDFNFPFYKKTVNKLYIYADGYIVFDDQPFTYPYLIDKMLLFRQTPIIAPFLTDLTIYPSSSQGVWYEGNANYAIIRWKASIYNMQSTTNLHFAVKLYPDGTIEYYYGLMTYPAGTSWTGGLSSGDNRNYQFSVFNNAASIPVNTQDKFASCGYPPEMQISGDGLFSGTPVRSYQNQPVRFRVTDNDNLTSSKVLYFSTYGLLVTHSVNSGGDTLIEYGETTKLSLHLNNVGSLQLHQLNFTLSESDPFITLTDSTESLNTINGGQTITLPEALAFRVSTSVPDNYSFNVTMTLQSQEQNFQRTLGFVAHAPVFRITGTQFNDGDNSRPDPGESADFLVTFKNSGSVQANAVNVQLTSADTNLALTVNTASMVQLKPDSSKTLIFHAMAGNEASFEHIYPIRTDLATGNGFTASDTLYLFAGEIVEDFETGAMEKFPWFGGGQAPWLIESGVKYEGNFSVRSNWIGDNQESKLMINVNVLTEGPLSFYRYVSCEQDPSGNHNYDYLVFLIDSYEMARWDGITPWSLETFSIPAGYHTLSWVYHKDYSVSSGWDGCLIDFIRFPLIGGAVPQISVTPLSIEKTLVTGESATETVYITNLGGGIMQYSVQVFDTAAAQKKSSNPGSISGSTITCGNEGFVPGQPFSWLFTAHNQGTDNEYIKNIRLDFVPGVIVTGATNFTGGSLGDLVFTGTTGNGASLNFHGENVTGRGVLKPGETASASVTGAIGKAFMNDAYVIFQMTGDGTGAPLHEQPGSVRIKNFGLPNGWVSLFNSSGTLTNNETGTVMVTVNTAGLTPDTTYRCNVVARDIYNNKFVIPLTLHITFPVGTSDEDGTTGTRLLGNFPNPFREETVIRYNLSEATDVTIGIFSLQGVKLTTLKPATVHAGSASIVWDGKDDEGNPLPAGVYVCSMKAGDFRGNLKMVLIR